MKRTARNTAIRSGQSMNAACSWVFSWATTSPQLVSTHHCARPEADTPIVEASIASVSVMLLARHSKSAADGVGKASGVRAIAMCGRTSSKATASRAICAGHTRSAMVTSRCEITCCNRGKA